MQSDWKVVYYEDEESRSEVMAFIERQKANNQTKIFSWLSLLEERGPELPRPYADMLVNGIHELRIKLSGAQTRILYFFCFKDFIVLTNVFTKTSAKVPAAEIKKAIERRESFLKRFDEKTLRRLYDEDAQETS
jgi:hypothetical protein